MWQEQDEEESLFSSRPFYLTLSLNKHQRSIDDRIASGKAIEIAISIRAVCSTRQTSYTGTLH